MNIKHNVIANRIVENMNVTDTAAEKEIDNFRKEDLERLGLETYPGCRVSLLESVKTEFGEDVLRDVYRNLNDTVVIRAVARALVENGLSNRS